MTHHGSGIVLLPEISPQSSLDLGLVPTVPRLHCTIESARQNWQSTGRWVWVEMAPDFAWTLPSTRYPLPSSLLTLVLLFLVDGVECYCSYLCPSEECCGVELWPTNRLSYANGKFGPRQG